MTKISTYNIYRRAYSNYTLAETFTGTWLAAMERTSELEHTNKDGEYLLRNEGEPANKPPAFCPVQAAWAYL